MLFVCLLHVLTVCGKVPTLTIGYQATVSHSPQAISVRSCPASIFYFHSLLLLCIHYFSPSYPWSASILYFHPSPATLYPLFFSFLFMACFPLLFSPCLLLLCIQYFSPSYSWPASLFFTPLLLLYFQGLLSLFRYASISWIHVGE